MDNIIEQLTGPTNPQDYVGRSAVIDSFKDLLTNTIRKNTKVKWVHISGSAGVGKSSLLRKFRMMAEEQKIATGSIEVPFSPKAASHFLTDIKQIIDEIAPEWRGFIRKRRRPEIKRVLEPPEYHSVPVNDEDMTKMLDMFFDDLEEINTKMEEHQFRNAIFLDDLDRLLLCEFSSILQIVPKIMERMMKLDYNLLFVTSGHFSADQHLQIQQAIEENYVLHFEITQFDFKDADLMLRRKGKLVKSQRDSVVQASTKVPFDLALRQLLQLKDLDPSKLDANTITNAFNFSPEELRMIKDLSKNEMNYFKEIDIFKVHTPEVLNELASRLLIARSQEGIFIIDSNAMWELISFVYKPSDPRTEAILLLNRIHAQTEMGQIPASRDVKILTDHILNIKDHALIFELAGQLSESAEAASQGGLAETSWNLMNVASLGLERTGDNELVADLQEKSAKNFADIKHNYFAAKSFEKAGIFFRKAEIEWKSVTNFKEAGQMYLQEADDIDLSTYHYAVRSMLLKAVRSFVNANESKKAKKVMEEALVLFESYEIHKNFFKVLEIGGN